VWNNYLAYRSIHNAYQIDIRKHPAIIYIIQMNQSMRWNRTEQSVVKKGTSKEEFIQTKHCRLLQVYDLESIQASWHLQILNYAGLTNNSKQVATTDQ